MHTILLRLSEILIVLFVFIGFLTIITTAVNHTKWQRIFLLSIPVLAITILAAYWNAHTGYRTENAVFWGRMMSGDGAQLLSLSCLGILLSSGFALSAMSLGNKFSDLAVGAVCFISIWYVIYLHPTPHYVPLTEEQDNMVWFILLAGCAAVCVFIYWILRSTLKKLRPLAAILAGIFAMIPLTLLFAHVRTSMPVNLHALSAKEQIKVMGCLSCHTMDGLGQEFPGGALESVASRSEDVVLAFMIEPTAEKAKELKIRDNPSGEMSGVVLTEEEAQYMTKAMTELFEVKPPSKLGHGNEHIEILLEENNCLACHTIKGEGAPEGGLGGALELSINRPHDVIVNWLMNPSADNAVKLNIRTEDEAMGAMDGLALNKEDSEAYAAWIKSLAPDSE